MQEDFSAIHDSERISWWRKYGAKLKPSAEKVRRVSEMIESDD